MPEIEIFIAFRPDMVPIDVSLTKGGLDDRLAKRCRSHADFDFREPVWDDRRCRNERCLLVRSPRPHIAREGPCSFARVVVPIEENPE